MRSSEKPVAAFALSLVAGVLMLASGVTTMTWALSGMPAWGGPMGGMMGGYGGMMGGMGFSGMGAFGGMSTFGLIAGVLVLVGALMLHTQPSQASTWGIIVLIFSILSLFGMGGFFIGAILGIIGGALALSWKPTASSGS
ncbi:MAG: hypothetical protein HYY68_08040 [Thaumarchaeota archaeon]|nr:hypothetical protein [Nitrososphaerota archaeon]